MAKTVRICLQISTADLGIAEYLVKRLDHSVDMFYLGPDVIHTGQALSMAVLINRLVGPGKILYDGRLCSPAPLKILNKVSLGAITVVAAGLEELKQIVSAVQAIQTQAKPLLLGVPMPVNLSLSALAQLGYIKVDLEPEDSPEFYWQRQVGRIIRNTVRCMHEAGLDGVLVGHADEVSTVREQVGDKFVIAATGVRGSTESPQAQHVREAVAAGAHIIMMGSDMVDKI